MDSSRSKKKVSLLILARFRIVIVNLSLDRSGMMVILEILGRLKK